MANESYAREVYVAWRRERGWEGIEMSKVENELMPSEQQAATAAETYGDGLAYWIPYQPNDADKGDIPANTCNLGEAGLSGTGTASRLVVAHNRVSSDFLVPPGADLSRRVPRKPSEHGPGIRRHDPLTCQFCGYRSRWVGKTICFDCGAEMKTDEDH